MSKTFKAVALGLSLLLATVSACSAADIDDYMKGVGAHNNKDYAAALREWLPLAKRGYHFAQNDLGEMYNDGTGVTQDYKEAVRWFRLSAEQGNANAMYNLGVMYAFGRAVIQDNVYAHVWFNIASSKNDTASGLFRDQVASIMTASQLEKAQDLARECVKKNYKGCR